MQSLENGNARNNGKIDFSLSRLINANKWKKETRGGNNIMRVGALGQAGRKERVRAGRSGGGASTGNCCAEGRESLDLPHAATLPT